MRSRIVGGVALLLGLSIVILMFASSKPLEFKAFLGGLLFIGMGGYYLFTGKKAATMSEFIVDGKLDHDTSSGDSPKTMLSLAEEATTSPDPVARSEALKKIALSNGVSEKEFENIALKTRLQVQATTEEILHRVGKQQGLSESEIEELAASLREKSADVSQRGSQ